MIKVGLLGTGGIGYAVADAVHRGTLQRVRIVSVAGSHPGSVSANAVATLVGAEVVSPLALGNGVDWVLEAAGAAAAREYLPALWGSGVNTVVMSAGVLLDADLSLTAERFRKAGGRIVVPSGAIAGLDGIRSMAATGGLEKVTITTTKAPAGLRGAPYLEENCIELSDEYAMPVFEGSAKEAARGFPANVNVAVTLGLAGTGVDKTTVVIRSDPAATRTVHHIAAEGDSASLEVTLRLKPSPRNPRTSYLAALSAISTLKELAQSTS